MNPSRRQLARYAAEQLIDNKPVREVARGMAASMIASKRAGDVDMLIEDICFVLQERGKLGKVTVTSARPMDSAFYKKLASELKEALSVEEVSLSEQVDPSVIGGLRIESATSTWDSTILTQLNNLKRTT